MIDVFLRGKSLDESCISVLAGDLNVWNPYSREEGFMADKFGFTEKLKTFPSLFPVFSLDRIYRQNDLPNGISLTEKWSVVSGRKLRNSA